MVVWLEPLHAASIPLPDSDNWQVNNEFGVHVLQPGVNPVVEFVVRISLR